MNYLTQFADATNAATTLLHTAQFDLTLAQRSGYEVAFTRYSIKANFTYPPKDFTLLEAIGKYAAALEHSQQLAKVLA